MIVDNKIAKKKYIPINKCSFAIVWFCANKNLVFDIVLGKVIINTTDNVIAKEIEIYPNTFFNINQK